MRKFIKLCEEPDFKNMHWWFWYNPSINKLVEVIDGTHTLYAAYYLGVYPEDHFKEAPDPEDSEIIGEAIKAGWVRGRYGSKDYEDTSGPWWIQPHEVNEDKRELSLQGTQHNVFLTAKKMIQQIPFSTLYVDFTTDEKMDKADSGHMLRGDRLEHFLKLGKIPSPMIMENHQDKVENFINTVKNSINPDNGVSVSFSKIHSWLERDFFDPNNGVVISFIATVPYERKKGKAGEVMRTILSLADTYGIVLCLEVYLDQEGTYGSLSSEQLRNWYAKLGFKENGNAMYRLPKINEQGQYRNLKDIVSYADDLGVNIDVSNHQEFIHLEWIDAFSANSVGAGKKVIDALCAFADSKNKKIVLTVWEGEKKLISHYEKFGFVQVTDDAEPMMERNPRATVNESGFKTTVNALQQNPDFKYFKNPSANLLLSLLVKSQYKELRGLAVGSDMYWWDASFGIHGVVAEMLGLEYDYRNRLYLYHRRGETTLEWVDDNWDRIGKHPQTLRYMASDKILFYAGSHGWLSGPEFKAYLNEKHWHIGLFSPSLNEGWTFDAALANDVKELQNNPDFKFFKNPSANFLFSLAEKSKEKELRGLVVGNDVYWWDAYYGIHEAVAKMLELDYSQNNRLYIYQPQNYQFQAVHPELKDKYLINWLGQDGYEKTKKHPQIGRYLKHNMFYAEKI